MIEQNIYLNDTKILSIYHYDFDNEEIMSRVINERQEIAENKVMYFTEKYITELNIESSYDYKYSGYLENNNIKNPYYSYSTNFMEFIKNSKTFFQDNKLLISVEEFKMICNFVYKKTGYNLWENPYSIENTILFYPNKIEYDYEVFESDNEINGIRFKNIFNKEDMVIIKLYYNKILQETKILFKNEKEVLPNKLWNSFDIEVYNNENIVFSRYDIYSCKIIFDKINIKKKEKKVQLNTQKEQVKISEFEKISTKYNEFKEEINTYFGRENIIRDLLKSSENDNFLFLGKGELKKAFASFSKLMEEECEEIWIFDPYAISYNVEGGVEKLRDIIKILSQKRNVKKNVIFEYKEDNPIDIFINKVFDKELVSLKKEFNGFNLEFFGSSEHFHDRFIFLINRNVVKGFLIGTSFNTFGDNYSIFLKLNLGEANYIFNKLKDGVFCNDKIVENKCI